METGLNYETISTAIAVLSTWGATRLLAFLKKKFNILRWVKPVYIAFALSILSVLLINILKLFPIEIKPIFMIWQIAVAMFMSGGIQANKNDIMGIGGNSSFLIKGDDEEIYSDFMDVRDTVIAPIKKEKEIFLPLEYMVIPNAYSRAFILKNSSVNEIGKTVQAVNILATKFYRNYKVTKPTEYYIKTVQQEIGLLPGELYILPDNVNIGYLDYILAEHSLISTLIGSDYVRTIFNGKDIYNIFNVGKVWYYVTSCEKTDIDYDNTMLGARGVIKGKTNDLAIKGAVYVDQDKILSPDK